MTRIGIGDFVAWDGGCVFIVRAEAPTGVHSHQAIQMAFGESDGILFKPSDQSDWSPYDGVVITSRQPHAMDATTVGRNAVIFVEPETTAGRALQARFDREGISSIRRGAFGRAAASLFSVSANHASDADIASAVRGVLRMLVGDMRPDVVTDQRILRAIEFINANLSGRLTLDAIARQAFLSPARFRHLFVEQTGTGVRPYILWRRFIRSWSLVREGAGLSTAAHEAGFADAAHLTRTSRRMFGFAPSTLLVGPRRDFASS